MSFLSIAIPLYYRIFVRLKLTKRYVSTIIDHTQPSEGDEFLVSGYQTQKRAPIPYYLIIRIVNFLA